MKSPLTPKQKDLALRYKAVTKCSIKEALRFAKKYSDDYSRYFSRRENYTPNHRETNMEYIYKEFIFQGFVPEDKFKKKPHRHYLVSNKPIRGKILIYPVHAWHDIRYRKEGEPWIYDLLDQVGVPGYTRVDLEYKL